MKHRKHVIGPTETLMIKARALDGSTYWSEQECCTYATWADVLSIVLSEDDVIKVVRFDEDDMRGEDITDAIVEAWCIENDPEDDGGAPAWMRSNMALQDYIEGRNIERAEDSVYGTYEQQVERTYRHAIGY